MNNKDYLNNFMKMWIFLQGLGLSFNHEELCVNLNPTHYILK